MSQVPIWFERKFESSFPVELLPNLRARLRGTPARPESWANASGDRRAAGDARRLLARSRLPPIRGYTPSAPRYWLRGVGCLKQMPNAVFQQFESPLQGAELSDPHYRDGHVQVK